MNIYLIGPSGVGKSNAARRASSLLQADHRDIDCLCAGHQFDWTVCLETLESIETAAYPDGRLCIVDIGAGTQCLPELVDYLLPRRDHVVLILAPAQEVLKRNPRGPDRPLDEYMETEYRNRQRLYEVAGHVVDVTGMSEVEASQLCAEGIKRHFCTRGWWRNLLARRRRGSWRTWRSRWSFAR